MFITSIYRFLPILLLAAILPFFEGCESPAGLVLVHSITLISLVFALFRSPIQFPKILRYFIPFLLILFVSTYIAPYKYSALLELWDYWIAGLFSILALTLLKENLDQLEDLSFLVFIVATISTIATVLTHDEFALVRWSGSFLNPNDFATFCLLLLIFGLFHFERLNSNHKKIAAAICILFLMIFITMASSRSVFIASAVVFAYYLWKKKTTRFMKIFIALVLVASTTALWIRFFFFDDPFQYYRLKIWKYSLQGILQDPYFGIGLNMLPFRASQFNFPADLELGRYSRVATSADNQYLQILIETGFLGFFLFIIGWIGLFFAMRRLDNRFLAFRMIFIAVSIISFFAIPFDNTAIMFTFIFLIIFPFAFESFENLPLKLNILPKIMSVAALSLILIFAVLIPYQADREFRLSLMEHDKAISADHLQKAIRLNPIQPYYPFSRIKQIVNSRSPLKPEEWHAIALYLEQLSGLNPLEPDFYIYQGKIYRILLESTGDSQYYAKAVSGYLSGIQLSPYNVFLRTEYAFFEFKRANLERSAAELYSILQLEPAYLNARLLLAQVKSAQGRRAEAKSEFQKVEALQNKYSKKAPSISEPYVRKLLQVDARYKEQVQRLIFE